jgi:hypothetical protein
MRAMPLYGVLFSIFLCGCKLKLKRSEEVDVDGQRSATLQAVEVCRLKGMELDVATFSALNPKEVPCVNRISDGVGP